MKNQGVLVTYLISILLLCGVFILGITYNIPFEKFTGNPALIFKHNPFIGIISNLGVLLWCTTSSICLFSGFLIYSTDKKYSSFLILSGVFSGILLFDDFFMIHDYAIYILIPHDLGQYIILAFYALFALFYFIKYYKIILSEKNHIIIGLAFLFLGLSVIIDVFFESNGLEYFIEDGFKFIGIVSWMLYFVTTSNKAIKKHFKINV